MHTLLGAVPVYCFFLESLYIYGWRCKLDVPELFPLDQAQLTVRVFPFRATVCCMMQSCILEGQYRQVKTPLAQEKDFNSFPPLLELIMEVTT